MALLAISMFHRWAIAPQYTEQFRIVLSIVSLSTSNNSARLPKHGMFCALWACLSHCLACASGKKQPFKPLGAYIYCRSTKHWAA